MVLVPPRRETVCLGSEDNPEKRPKTTHREFAENHAKEQGQNLAMEPQPAVPQFQPLDEPAQKEHGPQTPHLVSTGDRVTCRMEGPPQKLPTHNHQKDTEQQPVRKESHSHHVGRGGIGQPPG